MADQSPLTLAHLENFPLLSMSGEELLHRQPQFEANLKKAGMSLDSLICTDNPRNQEKYELALAYIELGEYAGGICTLDEMLVMCPLHFESCFNLLKLFHKFDMVELFNREAAYAHWVLTHSQDADGMAQYLRDWDAIALMGLELNENSFHYTFAPQPGCATVTPNNPVAFYAAINQRIADALRRQSVVNLNGSAIGETASAATWMPGVDEGNENAEATPAHEQNLAAKPDAESAPKRFNLLRERQKQVRQVGNSCAAENRIELVMICDRDKFEKRHRCETDKENRAQLENLSGLAVLKELRPIRHDVFAEIERIGQEQPNFSQVTELILGVLHAQCLAGMPATLPAVLLYGAPGVGKTRYIKRIAAALNLPYCEIPLSGSPDSFKISGLGRHWGNAGPGMISTTLANSAVANPIFLLDEIDKARRSDNGDPLARILLLLEQETAASFKDDFADMPINAAFASYLATANGIDELPEPLLNRFVCIRIEPLDYQGRCTMVQTVYRELCAQQKYGAFFSEDIPHATLLALAECDGLSGRELKRELQQALQRACRGIPLGCLPNRTVQLTADCLCLPEIRRSRSMGFM